MTYFDLSWSKGSPITSERANILAQNDEYLNSYLDERPGRICGIKIMIPEDAANNRTTLNKTAKNIVSLTLTNIKPHRFYLVEVMIDHVECLINGQTTYMGLWINDAEQTRAIAQNSLKDVAGTPSSYEDMSVYIPWVYQTAETLLSNTQTFELHARSTSTVGSYIYGSEDDGTNQTIIMVTDLGAIDRTVIE